MISNDSILDNCISKFIHFMSSFHQNFILPLVLFETDVIIIKSHPLISLEFGGKELIMILIICIDV
jgi:hypothetical protein